jgi:hypothetical protein
MGVSTRNMLQILLWDKTNIDMAVLKSVFP